MAFKMNGFPTHSGTTMAKQTTEAAKNLLKAVPNEDAYNQLSDENKVGFDKAAKKAGLPMEKTIAKQKVVKEGEGQDQNKIFDEKGNHVGNYVNGKKVMLKKDTPAKQKDQLDVIQQGQKVASDQVDLDEKKFQANTNKKKQDHQNRVNPITGTTT